MTPMIDCVFQLMIFFMLTLKIVSAEGNFDINMPIGQTAAGEPPPHQPIKVRLIADQAGNLASVQLFQRNLGNDQRAFAQLNTEILRAIGGNPGNALAKELEVEIDSDYNLHYRFVIDTITACMGRYDAGTKQVVRYIEKIKFAPPRKPVAN